MSSLLFSALAFICVHSQEPTANKYRVWNNRILDSSNRECFFHGVNVVYKSFPYLPITDHFDANLSFSIEDMQLLNELGQNVIRLGTVYRTLPSYLSHTFCTNLKQYTDSLQPGVMWPGVAPHKNSFNETYISAAAQLIEDAYTGYNISSLVDCHQDVLSEALCGEGAPIWATQPLTWNFPVPLDGLHEYATDSNHIPSREDCLSITWSTYYTAGMFTLDPIAKKKHVQTIHVPYVHYTEATCSAFQHLYDNHNGLTDAFADYWGKLASSFKSTPGVIGFELLNEPWAGGIYEDPFLMLPGNADRKNLAPFYNAIVPSIYGNDSDRLVFFESVTWTDEFNISLTETGFERVPGGEQYANQSVFSFHYYVPPNEGSEDKYFYERTRDAIRWNATSFLTEFDISNDAQDEHVFEKMSTTMDYCDEYLVSWIGWEYKPFAGATPTGTCTGCGYGLFLKNGNPNDSVRKAVSRTYAQSVAGRTRSMSFDWKHGGNFSLVFDADTNIKAPTIIFTNKQYWYPNGFDVKVTPTNAVNNVVKTDSGVEIYNSNDSQYNGQTVTVILNAK